MQHTVRLAMIVGLTAGLLVSTASPVSAADTSVQNTGLAAGETHDFGFFLASEVAQSADLNGDGDMLDPFVGYRQIAGKPVQNLGIAMDGTEAVTGPGTGAFLPAHEAGQGVDFNGDGDMTDQVLHWWAPGRGLTNLGKAGFAWNDGIALVSVLESQEGADLNGDGDMLDGVAHAFDPDTLAFTNLGLALARAALADPGVLFSVDEAKQGATDLNGDGDAVDEVMYWWDRAGGAVPLGLAGEPENAGYFVVDEAAHFGVDRNGDGDATDDVLHKLNVVTKAATNLGLATVGATRPLDSGGLIFTVNEPDQGATDLNGDGDALDRVVHVDRPDAGVTNLGVAGQGFKLFLTEEADQGADLNGDGDMVDFTQHYYDEATNTVHSAGVAVIDQDNAVGPGFLIEVNEPGQGPGGTDLNGDGDKSDRVVHFWVPGNAPVNLGIDGRPRNAPGAFNAGEASQGADLNGDGDMLDEVVHYYDYLTASIVNTGLALDSDFDFRPRTAGRSGFHFGVSEAAQGATDLNGDGDAADVVIHTFTHFVQHDVGLVDTAQGRWHLRARNGSTTSFFYGNPGDSPFAGDWDCDGIATPGLYRVSDGFAYLRNTNTQGIADIRFFFGNPGDVPLAGDFDGDGCDTLSLYRPSEQKFFIINELGKNEGGLGAAAFDFVFGNPGDQPFVGDLDGDGIDEVGLHRASTGFVYYRTTLTTGVAEKSYFFGDPGDRFVAGDWGVLDGVETPAVFRPSSTTFFFRHTNTQGNADSQFVYGEAPWIPVGGLFGLS